MREESIIEVSDILETFNIAELTYLIKNQINGDIDDFVNNSADHFRPLYRTYAKLSKYETIDEDVRNEAEDRYFKICRVFLEEIFTKFNIELDSEWLTAKESSLPSIAIAFYSMFVIDFVKNLYEVVLNYIASNPKLVYETFEDLKAKKDAATLNNKKTLSPEMTVVVSNIYDIVKWIFMNMSEEEFLDYLDDGYVPLQLIKPLYTEGIMSGEFVKTISDLIENNINLSSTIGFMFSSAVKKGDIRDFYQD